MPKIIEKDENKRYAWTVRLYPKDLRAFNTVRGSYRNKEEQATDMMHLFSRLNTIAIKKDKSIESIIQKLEK
jgi:hypothetical protein